MTTSTTARVDINTPHFKLGLKQEMLRLNAPRMLAFCCVFVVFNIAMIFVYNLSSLYGMLDPTVILGGIWPVLKITSLALGLVFVLLFSLMVAGSIHSPRAQGAILHACLILLGLTQFGLFALEISNGSLFAIELSSNPYFLSYYLVYALLLGVLPLLTRAQSALYLVVFTALCWLWLCFSVPSLPSWPSMLINTSNPNLAFIGYLAFIALVVLVASLGASWSSYALVKKNVIAQKELEQQQIDLETLVEERTIEYKDKAHTAEVANLAKTRFLTRVSHEMRTSMNTISGMAFLAKETDDPASRQESLEAIDQASQKLKSIVDNIIDTTKIELDFAGDDFNQDFALLSSDADAPQHRDEHVEAPHLSGHNILIVEDLETNRLVLREFLKDTEAHVEEAVNGKEAVEMFAASPENYYSFVFMDLLMPEMNGHDATRAIRKMERADAIKVPIVAVSANAFKEDIEASLAAGMDAHLAKPIEQTEIFCTLIERLT